MSNTFLRSDMVGGDNFSYYYVSGNGGTITAPTTILGMKNVCCLKLRLKEAPRIYPPAVLSLPLMSSLG